MGGKLLYGSLPSVFYYDRPGKGKNSVKIRRFQRKRGDKVGFFEGVKVSFFVVVMVFSLLLAVYLLVKATSYVIERRFGDGKK